MRFLREGRTRRWIAAMLLVSLAPAAFAPLVTARPSTSSRLYAEWLDSRIGEEMPLVVRATLRDAGSLPARTLSDFVSNVVHTLVVEEGLAFASMALVGRLVESEARLLEVLLGGVRSLGAAGIPPATQISQPDVSRAAGSRTDPGIFPAAVASDRHDAIEPAVRVDPAATRVAPRPGRGDVQPLGP